jgi:uncharacterized protein
VTVSVGVLADTHCPEFIDRLPERVGQVLQGVQLILHAGDIDGPETIVELERIAPVEAVRGDHDRMLTALPASREVTIEGKRIVVTHGNVSRWLEEPMTLLWTLSLGYLYFDGLLVRALRRRYPRADVIVYGHTHRPRIAMVGGALVFNPGGVHQWNPETARHRLGQRLGWFEWCWLQVARHIRRHPTPTVGILDIGPSGVVPRVIPL